MNKILKISVATVLSSFLLIGCSETPDAPDVSEMSSVEVHSTQLHNHMTQKKLSSVIKEAGENAGWKMTEFKSDTFIAEKTEDENTISSSVKFNENGIEINPENDDLEDAINKALDK